MFVLHADKTKIDVLEKEVVTTGSVNVYQCKISFSEDWNDLIKTAVFKVGNDSKSVLLTDVGQDEETGEQFSYCTIPATILDEYNRTLYIGLYGILGDEIILPTIWQSLGTVREGVIIGDIIDGGSDGNTIHDQILAELSKKGDNIEYDRTSSTLSLKSGDNVLSSVTIMEGSGSTGGTPTTPTVAGVKSFNGRSGVVRPMIGDYTAEMVGALPDDTFIPSTASDIGADPAGTATEQVQTLREEVDSRLDDKISSSGGTMVAPLNFTFGDNASVQVFSARDVSATGSISMQEDGLTIESSNKSIGFSGSSLKNIGVAIEDNDAVSYKQMQDHTKTVVENAVNNVEVPTKVSQLQNDARYATETYVNDVLSGIEGGGGVVGTPGKDGKSAYEIAVENGFVGTEKEWLESLQGQPGENGEPGTPGENGFSPTVSVTETDDGHTVSITDADGTKSFEVLNGLNGVDGVSPTVNIAPTSENDGTVVTITDIDGTKSFTVLNGENGLDGTNGTDGKSAYQIAVDNGFEGTEQEWLESLQGTSSEAKNGLPIGGTTGQILAKASDKDFDTNWIEPSSGGGSSTVIKEIILTTDGWNTETLEQTVTVDGVLADPLKQEIHPTPADDSREIYNDCEVICISQSENALTFSATEIPTEDLSVYVSITSANVGGATL